jgi:hypothetical protein
VETSIEKYILYKAVERKQCFSKWDLFLEIDITFFKKEEENFRTLQFGMES